MTISNLRKITMSRYNETNKEKILFQSAEYRDNLRLEMVEAYGGACKDCGESDPIVLTLDHVNDDPGPEYELAGKSSRGGYNLYRRLRREGWPQERFQLLCFNCNMRKEHKRRRDGMIERWGEAPESATELTRGEARAKAGANINNRSGFKGVIWLPGRQRWQAQIRANEKFIYIGKFTDIRDAAKAYREKAKEIWGEFYTPLSDEEIEQMATSIPQGNIYEIADKTLDELGL